MTVAEYEATFAWLERFAQVFDSEERWANRFLKGLQPILRVKVMGCQCMTVADMVQMASHFEEGYQQYLGGRSKGRPRRPLLLGSRSLVHQVPMARVAQGRGRRTDLVVSLVPDSA